MSMKFVGGPNHGRDVPRWARGLPELYAEDAAVQSPVDGCWDHSRVRYTRQTLTHLDGRKTAYLAAADVMPTHEFETAARALFEGMARV